MKRILFFIFCLFQISNLYAAQITYDVENDSKRIILEACATNDTELYSLISALDSGKLDASDIDTLAELNAILTDVTLIDSGNIADSTTIGLDDGSTYTNYGDVDDDTINELFSAINTKFGTLAGGHDPVTVGTANGLSLSAQILSLAIATNSSNGAMSASWITFLESIDTEAEFKALYNLEAGTDYYSVLAIDTLLANKLSIANIDDIPVNGVVNAPISSNWAYDHENATDPHTQYLQQTDIDALQTDDLNTLSGVSIGSTDLGTFTGSTIQDNRNNKEAFQDLETEVETKSDSFTTLAQLNAFLSDANLIDDGAISDSILIGLVNGGAYTNFGAISDDTLNEMFQAIDNAIGALGGGHDPVTIGTANGLSLASQVLSLSLATNLVNGAMSSAWVTFLESIDTEAELKSLYNLEVGVDYYSISAVDTAIANLQADDLVTLSGVAIGSTDLGTFTGSTITDNVTNKVALQELETAVEAINDHDSVTIGTANGLSLSSQIISLALADNANPGAISAAWITFLESIDTEAEFKALYNLEIGTDVLAQQTIGIADNNLLEVDGTDGDPNSAEYARFTASGLEGRTEAEFKSDFNLEIGTDIQAQNDYLADISGLTPTQYYLLGWDGASNVINISEINDSIIPSGVTRDSELTDSTFDLDVNSVTTVELNIAGVDGDRTFVINCNTYATGFTPTAGETGFACVEDVSGNPVLYYYEDGGSLTEFGTGSVTADSTTTFTNKTIDANGTGNSITNIETPDIAAATLITSSETGTTATDTQIPTWKAVKDYLDSIIVSGLPIISITTPSTSGTWVDSATYTSLAGTAFDLQDISEIAWKLESGGTYATTGVSGTTSWTVSSITLAEGTNNVYARVTDTDTNTEEDTTVINVDTIDPVNSDGGTDATHDGATLITLDVDNNDTNEVTCTYSSTELSLTDVAMTTTGSTGAWTVTDSSIDPNGSTNTIDLTVTCTDPAGNFDTDTYNITYSAPSSYLFEWGAENLTAETYDVDDGGTITVGGGASYSFVTGQTNNAIQLNAESYAYFTATDGNNINWANFTAEWDYRYDAGTPGSGTNIFGSPYESPEQLTMRYATATLIGIYVAGTFYNTGTVSENIFDGNWHHIVFDLDCSAQTLDVTLDTSTYNISLGSTTAPNPATERIHLNGYNATTSNQQVTIDNFKIQ